uniref:Uncharacterized protein n=1 Tax=Oryza barthii TaxID=65489 RepID=A0A0D3H6G8_9ORYZ
MVLCSRRGGDIHRGRVPWMLFAGGVGLRSAKTWGRSCSPHFSCQLPSGRKSAGDRRSPVAMDI